MYNFTMPYPPTLNHYHQPVRIGKSVRIIKGAKARQYAKDMELHLESLGLRNEMINESVKLSVTLTLNPPTLARYDVDNRAKGVLDALSNANFYADDSQIHRLTVIKGEKTKGGNVIVKVEVME
jgi:crossover junction endodeoxyribonuclease RusA